MSRKVGKSINILFYFYSKIITDFAIKKILFQCGRSKKFKSRRVKGEFFFV